MAWAPRQPAWAASLRAPPVPAQRTRTASSRSSSSTADSRFCMVCLNFGNNTSSRARARRAARLYSLPRRSRFPDMPAKVASWGRSAANSFRQRSPSGLALTPTAGSSPAPDRGTSVHRHPHQRAGCPRQIRAGRINGRIDLHAIQPMARDCRPQARHSRGELIVEQLPSLLVALQFTQDRRRQKEPFLVQERSVPSILAQLSSGFKSGLFSLHLFQLHTPFLSRAKCSSSAIPLFP